MKHIIVKTFAALLIAGGMTSCSDFLDQKSESSLDDTAIFGTPEYVDGAIGNIYQEFGEQNYRARSIWYGYNTDLEVYNSSNKGDDKAALATYDALPNNNQMNSSNGTDLWAKMYSAIERANLAIKGLRANADMGLRSNRQYLGEALTLRALFYVDLINMWGDVPARFEPVTTEAMYSDRVDRDVIYKQLIADLQEASELCVLPNDMKVTETVERVNQLFCKGLLARVCMQAAGYAQRMDGENRRSTDSELQVSVLYPIALEACKDIMAYEGSYVSLKSNFEDIWNNNGICGDVIAAGSESLFEIGYSNTPARGRIMYTFGLKHNTEDNMTAMNKGSEVGPVPTLFFDYEKNDTRRDVTCCPFQWNKGKQVLQAFKSWSFGKLRYEWTNRLIPNGNDDGINRLYMRYADVVLMRAELENELNGPEAAAPWLEKVRKRAYGGRDVSAYINKVKQSKESMFNAIVDERGLEFAGEFIRKADLIRWGLLKTKMDVAKAKMNAIVNLEDYDESHPYSQLSGHVYYKMSNYNWARNGVAYTENDAKLNFYGLEYGQMDLDPEGYTEYADSKGNPAVWIKEGALDDVKDYLYLNDPDKRQYWPIFNVNLQANPTLKNYSWY